MNLMDLVVKVVVDKSDFDTGMDETESQAEELSNTLGGKLAGAAKFVGGAVTTVAATTAAAGAAMLATAKSTASYGDNIDKASQKLGISSKAYQEWEAVLQHSGTSMDSMGASFRKLANASQDASDDQVAAFKRIGLSMEEVANMSTEELWARTIKGLQGMEEGTERTALATELLGRGAMELGPLLNTSADDTQKMIDRVNELGGVMSEDAVKASAQFQDSLQDMKTSFAGVKNAIGASLLPKLTELMDFVADRVPESGGVVSSVVGGITTVMGGMWNGLQAIYAGIKDGLDMVSDEVGDTGVDWGKVWDGIGKAATIAGKVIGVAVRVICAVIAQIVRESKIAIDWFKSMKNSITDTIDTAKNKFQQFKDKVSDVMNSAKKTVSDAISNIKSLVNFSWSLPHLKVPHFSVSGGAPPWGFMGQGSLPHVNVSWYAKAMDDGYMFTRPTVLSTDVGYKGFGDAGAEMVIGKDNLMRMIREATANGDTALLSAILRKLDELKVAVEAGHDFYLDKKQWVGSTVKDYNKELGKLADRELRGAT